RVGDTGREMSPTRRAFLTTAASVASFRSAKAFALLRAGDFVPGRRSAKALAERTSDSVVKNGRLKQSVSRWCYQRIPMPEFCKAVADMGLTAIDLLEEPDWAGAREHGLTCSMGCAGGGS